MTAIRNPKLAVIGASGSELAQIKTLLASKGIDLVSSEEADATVNADWVLEPPKGDIHYTEDCCVDDIESIGIAQHGAYHQFEKRDKRKNFRR